MAKPTIHRCARCISQAGCYASCARAPDGIAARLAAALRARGDQLGEPQHSSAEAICAADKEGERAFHQGLHQHDCPYGPEYDHDGFERDLAHAWLNAWRCEAAVHPHPGPSAQLCLDL